MSSEEFNAVYEAQFKAMQDMGLNIPAPAYTHFGAELIRYVPDQSLKIQFPLRPEYENPTGGTLGGLLSVYFDLAYGPFSYLVAQGAVVSLDLNTTFVRPLITQKDKVVIVEAVLINQSKSYLLMEGKAYKSDGSLVATSTTRMRKL